MALKSCKRRRHSGQSDPNCHRIRQTRKVDVWFRSPKPCYRKSSSERRTSGFYEDISDHCSHVLNAVPDISFPGHFRPWTFPSPDFSVPDVSVPGHLRFRTFPSPRHFFLNPFIEPNTHPILGSILPANNGILRLEPLIQLGTATTEHSNN